MGKTVESFRIALEGEISRWSGFARALRKPDREAFNELMDMCRSYASESGNATNPIIFEPMGYEHYSWSAKTDIGSGKEAEHKPTKRSIQMINLLALSY